MTRCLACLVLTALSACLGNGDPDADTKRLSELPAPKLLFAANQRFVWVEIDVDPWSVRACAILDDSFQATLNGVPMTITHRGESVGSIYSGDPCISPELRLDNPPVAAAAMLVMSYPRHTITVDLADLLAPRSAQLVPDGPWTFTSGQAVTLQWSPRSDFTTYTPSIRFVYDYLPVTVVDDRMSFTLPDMRAAGGLELFMKLPGQHRQPPYGDVIDWPSCTGASCQLRQTPQVIQPIAWQP
jgi:hypothetical protein